MPNLLIHATESPPPMSEYAPFAVASTIASAIAREPAVKLSNSNTPAGPFQSDSFRVPYCVGEFFHGFGTDVHAFPAFGYVVRRAYLRVAVVREIVAGFRVFGQQQFNAFLFSFFTRLFARSRKSFSTIDFPILPPLAFMKV